MTAENITQQIEKEVNPNSNLYNWTVLYTNLVFRGLISFGVSIIVVFILRIWLKTSIILTLIIAFLVSIAISPFFSRINIGSRLIDKYVMWLNKTFGLQ